MKKSIRTFLKSAEKDKIARSANPAIVRASTIYFETMQELRKHQKKISKGENPPPPPLSRPSSPYRSYCFLLFSLLSVVPRVPAQLLDVRQARQSSINFPQKNGGTEIVG